ncbi:Reverse transcriptase [Phytophthora palmivora]|uniref:Reverse transcriptase n=1 Tax=Phytophthora palmivora TaxID=4796 RepID=A0A2P4YC22_9STRA|nr:Reverse transcriptase [Phytophthora palmivora]
MASGFWVVPMTDRARSISAFITPFGLFEWNRMPFGLKNAPQIYQRLLDNALYGFVKDIVSQLKVWRHTQKICRLYKNYRFPPT